MKHLTAIVAALLIGVATQLQAATSPAALKDTDQHSLEGIPMCEGIQPEQVSATTWEFMLRNGFYSDRSDHREALYPMVCED